MLDQSWARSLQKLTAQTIVEAELLLIALAHAARQALFLGRQYDDGKKVGDEHQQVSPLHCDLTRSLELDGEQKHSTKGSPKDEALWATVLFPEGACRWKEDSA